MIKEGIKGYPIENIATTQEVSLKICIQNVP
jgi:hypothetical protein